MLGRGDGETPGYRSRTAEHSLSQASIQALMETEMTEG